MYKLVKSGSYYFLSRPRRFGKSLLISTLEAYFEAKRDLFEGLAVETLEKDWVKRPVFHLDLNIGKYDTPDSLDKILNETLDYWESLYGTRSAETTLALRFAGVVGRAYAQSGERVAILIDEYDKPLLPSYRQRGTATRIPQHSETFLWRTENHGRLHQVCLADGSDQVWQSQCVQ